MRISHKLYEGHHIQDVPSRKIDGKDEREVSETIPEFGPAVASSSQPSTFVPKKSELLVKTIRSYENMLYLY